jgi:hypothetical protein
MKITIFWDITLCSPLKVNRRFGGIHRLHLQGRKINQARSQRGAGYACYLLSSHLLLGLFFDPEDGGDIFLRNIRLFPNDTVVGQFSRYSVSNVCRSHFDYLHPLSFPMLINPSKPEIPLNSSYPTEMALRPHFIDQSVNTLYSNAVQSFYILGLI